MSRAMFEFLKYYRFRSGIMITKTIKTSDMTPDKRHATMRDPDLHLAKYR